MRLSSQNFWATVMTTLIAKMIQVHLEQDSRSDII